MKANTFRMPFSLTLGRFLLLVSVIFFSSSADRRTWTLCCMEIPWGSWYFGGSRTTTATTTRNNVCKNYARTSTIHRLLWANQLLHLFGMCLQHFIRSSPQHVLNLFWPFFATAGKHMVTHCRQTVVGNMLCCTISTLLQQPKEPPINV